jgi:hypothetical protein
LWRKKKENEGVALSISGHLDIQDLLVLAGSKDLGSVNALRKGMKVPPTPFFRRCRPCICL